MNISDAHTHTPFLPYGVIATKLGRIKLRTNTKCDFTLNLRKTQEKKDVNELLRFIAHAFDFVSYLRRSKFQHFSTVNRSSGFTKIQSPFKVGT